MRTLSFAVPVLVLFAAACDNSILVAQGAHGDAGAGESDGGAGAGDAPSAPGDATTKDAGPPFEGANDGATNGDDGPGVGSQESGAIDAATDVGPGSGGDGAVGTGPAEGGPGEASADAGAGEAGSLGDGSAGNADASSTPDSGGAPDAAPDAALDATPDAGRDADPDAAPDAGSGEGGSTHGPSCDGLPTTCGPNHDEDCCSARTVPGGSFHRDNNASYPATVDTFVLDRFEVTVGRFRKFYAQYPGNQPTGGSGINVNDPTDPGWDPKWDSSLPSTQSALNSAISNTATSSSWIDWTVGDDTLPMNCITWYEAYDFCIWDGGRLPTELEWNYAAAGGSEQRPYPWSTSPSDMTIDSTYAVYADMFNPASVYADVGSRSPKGDGRWGHADLAGNEAEWVEDWYGSYPATCTDCADVPWNDSVVLAAPYRYIRGGSAGDDSSWVLTSARDNWNVPSLRIDNYGVRCARNP